MRLVEHIESIQAALQARPMALPFWEMSSKQLRAYLAEYDTRWASDGTEHALRELRNTLQQIYFPVGKQPFLAEKYVEQFAIPFGARPTEGSPVRLKKGTRIPAWSKPIRLERDVARTLLILWPCAYPFLWTTYRNLLRACHDVPVVITVPGPKWMDLVHEFIQSYPAHARYAFAVVTNLSDIWVQDYGPLFTVQGESRVAVIAGYEPLGAEHFPRKTCIDPLPWAARELAGFLADAICDLDVALDWGNFVYHGRSHDDASVVMTKAVKKQNKALGLRAIQAQLESVFSAKIMFADCEEDDPVGHIDGSVRFVDADTVIIPKYSEEYRPGRRNKELLERHFTVHTIDGPESRLTPFCTGDESCGDYDAFGCYLNFIELPKAIVMPAFGVRQDQAAEARLRDLFKKEIRTVNCDLLSASGGALHCISKSIPWEVEW